LGLACLLWRRRTSGEHFGGVVPPATPLANAGRRLAAAVSTAEAAPGGSPELDADASRAIVRLWALIGPADEIRGLLSEANRMVRGEAPQAKPFTKEFGGG
jgi:hypothetical protein